AATNWGNHARGEAESVVQDNIFKTFLTRGKRESTYQIQIYSRYRRFIDPGMSHSVLHLLAENGLVTIIKGDFYAGEGGLQTQIHATDIRGATALHWAAWSGEWE